MDNPIHCLICGAPLSYRDKAASLTCAGCGKTFMSYAQCERGHYICDACHSKAGLLACLLYTSEEGLPEHVNDYIRILVQKSSRLKALIDDLFSLAKATSKNLEIRREKLDFCRLVRQVLGNLEEDILRAGLHVKVNIPAISLFIESDGGRLCRVLENLLMNALKYSLKGSRIFLDVGAAGDVVVFRLKNTANYEMDFDEEEVLQRFVRGDKTRSTEGSGLGLAIAKSFTEACGGTFQVFIDGDQFKAEASYYCLYQIAQII